jgi:hypothetical protein
MPEDERVARARRLRERIARLTSDEGEPPVLPADESPRDFVHRRMRERDPD